jgi:hypothetical protein
LFSAAEADLIMQPTLVAARRILFLLIAPLLRTFFEKVRECQVQEHNPFLMDIIRELHDVVGGTVTPRLWTVTIGEKTPGLLRLQTEGFAVALGDLLREPADRGQRLPCVPLVVRSGREAEVIPSLDRPLRIGDEILFCGRRRAFHILDATLCNDYTLRYLITGVDEPRGYAMRWLLRKWPALKPVS